MSMFNRQIQIGIVKPPKDGASDKPDASSEGYPEVPKIVEITASVKTIGELVIKGILLYVAVDTARQVIVKSTKEG